MTPNELDLARAKEIVRLLVARSIRNITSKAAWDAASIDVRINALVVARAIRETDAARGLVVVPRKISKHMPKERTLT